mmetsp:Transcript_25367/g.62825  ORF Transcript_25367/g.62825 Transcript_25367/m.62825 type:complete len:92 (-) Transcript_25367:783-1058(-)
MMCGVMSCVANSGRQAIIRGSKPSPKNPQPRGQCSKRYDEMCCDLRDPPRQTDKRKRQIQGSHYRTHERMGGVAAHFGMAAHTKSPAIKEP